MDSLKEWNADNALYQQYVAYLERATDLARWKRNYPGTVKLAYVRSALENLVGLVVGGKELFITADVNMHPRMPDAKLFTRLNRQSRLTVKKYLVATDNLRKIIRKYTGRRGTKALEKRLVDFREDITSMLN